MKKWFKFFGATVASAAASATLSTLSTHPQEVTNVKLLATHAAAGALVAALTLLAKNPLSAESVDNAELKKSAEGK